ncbi:MAG: hypothetical protein KME23_17625 [Goleter apudmare HA4340-LM2]|jgi:hypothetical protein|nr:hypothetical protein [Goleter apudmare HA4340-LM2]MBW4644781.1 hypothetical protein [Goleter apudmare HA4340-LM2]
MSKGGKTRTTWKSVSSWQYGETKVIRVPVALEVEIMAYARALDRGDAVLHGNAADIVLEAIAKYILFKCQNYHPNQHSNKLDTNTRAWDELRKFKTMVQTQPEILGLKN